MMLNWHRILVISFLTCQGRIFLSADAVAGQYTGGFPPEIVQESQIYSYQEPTKGGTGKIYMGREISRVLDHSAAAWLDRPTRQSKEMPDLVVETMDLDSADVVADMGAGSGYYTFRISPIVRHGKVFAVDIQPEMLDIIRVRVAERGVENVVPMLGTVTSPGLPDTSVHKVLMVDAYHEFSHPREMMEAIVSALRWGGLVFLIEYRGEDPDIPIKPLHKMTERQAKREMEAVGLRWKETGNFLPQQHFIVFEKPRLSPANEK